MHKEKSALGFRPCLGLLETLSLASVAGVVAAGTLGIPAQAALLARWRFDPAANQLEITLKEETTPRYFLLAQPPRIVLDLPNTKLGNVTTQQSYSGAVRQIRVSQFQPDVTRIVMELSPDVVLQPEQVQLRAASSLRWLLRPLIASQKAPVAAPVSLTALPPATFENRRIVSVKVPPLNRSATSTAKAPATAPDLPAMTLPPTTSSSDRQPTVSVPPLQRATSQTSASETASAMELAQPLPRTTPTSTAPTPRPRAEALGGGETITRSVPPLSELPVDTGTTPTASATPAVVVPPLNSPTATASAERATPTSNGGVLASEILLPAGTQLILRYPGKTAIALQAGLPRQEVLVLQEALRDRAGKEIAPAGTPVMGRFETDSSGSRFITQAITLSGRNLPLSAHSVLLPGNRVISSYNRIEPNQTLSVQLREDLRQEG